MDTTKIISLLRQYVQVCDCFELSKQALATIAFLCKHPQLENVAIPEGIRLSIVESLRDYKRISIDNKDIADTIDTLC